MEQTLNRDATHDTIAAVATPGGEGGIAVIRISGPQALRIADTVWRGRPLAEAASHTLRLGRVVSPDGEVLDQAVAAVMRAPGSYTGEDTVELSVHGSRWIQRETVNALVSAGARPADPGEFTRRAFLNGKLDLAQAEGVADLISASSKAAHRLAVSQLDGTFSSRLEQLRSRLVDFASLLELELDFSEEDVTFADRKSLRGLAEEIVSTLSRMRDSYRCGRAFKEGVPVVIAGAPNAGKSTLLNRLLDSDRAIVSDIPGTTRDIIEETREIGGILFRFIDTAGLRATEDEVERIGIDRALERIRRSAITLWLVDSSAPDCDASLAEIRSRISQLPTPDHLILHTKSDLAVAKAACAEVSDAPRELRISAKTGEGITELSEVLTQIAGKGHDIESELILTNERHLWAVEQGLESMERAREGLLAGISADFIAQDVREVLHHLGTVTGAVTTDTLLSTIFSRFCIGK